MLPIPHNYFHACPQIARLGYQIFIYLNTLEHNFNVSGSNFCLTPIPEREKNHLNRQFFPSCRSRGSNPGLQHSKQVCYPLHHCLLGNLFVLSISQFLPKRYLDQASTTLSKFLIGTRIIPLGTPEASNCGMAMVSQSHFE